MVGCDGDGGTGLRDTAVYKAAGSALRRASITLLHEEDTGSADPAGDEGAGLPDK